MKDESLTPKLTIPLFEKVYVTEVYQNRAENLIGIGLKSSVAVIQLIYDDSNATIGYELLHKIDHGCRVQCFAWSPATNCMGSPRLLRYATGGADHNVRLVSSDLTLNPHEAVRVLRGHRDYVNSLAFHPGDGSQVVSGSDDHTVILWDAAKGNQLHTVAFRSAVMSVAWHPEEVSKLMIGEKNGVIHIFNIVSYHAIMSLDCGSGPLSAADWSLSNSLLVAAAVRSDVTVWDLSKMAPISKTYLRQDIVRNVKMAPFSESILATTGLPSYNVKISNTKNSHVFQVMANIPTGGVSWHPRKHLLVVGHDEKLSVFHIAANKLQT